MKRWLRRIGKVFLGFCLLWALVHVIEDWRGKRAWEAWQRDQIAKGAVYDLAQLQGPPIPDGDNFAKAPVIQAQLSEQMHPIFSGGFKLEAPQKIGANWRTGHAMDLQAWMVANHTSDLAAFLAPAAPRLEELAQAAKRPGNRFDLPKDDSDISFGLMSLRAAARALNLRALAALRSGKTDPALRDVLTELRLARQVGQDRAIIAQTLQISLSGIAMQTVWEGLESHAWDESQLTQLQDELSKADTLTPFLAMGQDDRILQFGYWSTLSGHPWWDRKQSFGENASLVLGNLLIPRGWFYQNQLRADRFLAETWIAATDPKVHRVYPDRAKAMSTWWSGMKSTPYSIFAKHMALTGDMVSFEAQSSADHQVALDEAFVVCALERYRLARKAYPDSLDSLMPAYAAKLPCDVFTGAPLHYWRDGDGFLLYSIGWDGKDEGGLMAMDGKGRDLSKGDWPWPQAAR
jgi:hypothetical protein